MSESTAVHGSFRTSKVAWFGQKCLISWTTTESTGIDISEGDTPLQTGYLWMTPSFPSFDSIRWLFITSHLGSLSSFCSLSSHSSPFWLRPLDSIWFALSWQNARDWVIHARFQSCRIRPRYFYSNRHKVIIILWDSIPSPPDQLPLDSVVFFYSYLLSEGWTDTTFSQFNIIVDSSFLRHQHPHLLKHHINPLKNRRKHH